MNDFSQSSFSRQGVDLAGQQAEITLTDIRPTKKGRLALFCMQDGEEQFLFSVDEETAALQHIRIGTRLSLQQLTGLQQCSDLRRAKDKALQLLSLRDHGSMQLYRKLCTGFDEHTAAATVAEMQRLGLLDDGAFARRRVCYLVAKGKSRTQIRQDLSALGIDRELARQVLEETPDDEQATLTRLIEGHYKTKLAQGKREAVFAALLRRGFPVSAVRRAMQTYSQEQAEYPEYFED